MLVYVDSSMLGRAYLPDEEGHAEAVALQGGDARLVTAPITVIEVTGLLVRAHRAGRLASDVDAVLATVRDDLGPGGTVVPVRPPDAGAEEAMALEIVISHGIGALDALHIACARIVLPDLAAPGERTAFASRDGLQAAAAKAYGLEVV